MKKTFRMLALIFSALVLFSCAEKPEEVVAKPDVEVKDSVINIALPNVDNMKYLNIFRAVYDDVENKIREDSIRNIAQVVPKSNKITAFTYTDEYLVSGIKYVYKIRYWDGIAYKVTSWSDPLSVVNLKYAADSDLTYDIPSEVYLEYDSILKTLSFAGFPLGVTKIDDIDKSEAYYAADGSHFNCSLVFSYGEDKEKVTKLFSSEKRIDMTETAKSIDLRTLLTSDFFDKDIKLEYIVGQQIQKQTSKAGSHIHIIPAVDSTPAPEDLGEIYYVRYIWMLPAEIKMKDTSGNDLTTINIPLNTAEEGGDYSDTAVDTKNGATTPSMRTIPDFSQKIDCEGI